ncbi:MAG TPA: hypothetical protein VHM88_17020 [Candidatus Acidoferrales bacterium]|nr:hypothetical protein [Candidatus Acidoferrales bacterium]
MACAGYKESLTEAALGGLELERAKLAAHLAVCAACRAVLEDERRLVTAIDRGLAASVAEEPSRGFASRVLRHVQYERLPARSGLRGWAPAAAAALAVLALGAIWLARRGSGPPGQPRPQEAAVERRPDIEQAAAPASPVQEGHLPAPAAERITAHRRGSTSFPVGQAAAGATEPEVLVPPNEEALVMAVYRTSWSSPLDAPPLGAPLEVSELSIAPLEVRPLDGDSK